MFKSGTNNCKFFNTHYYPPEIMPITICIACLGIVLKENPEAKELYKEIVECFKLPGFQEVFNKLDDEIPEGNELIKKIIDKSGLDYNKSPDMKDAGIPQARNVINGVTDLAFDYTEVYTPWVLEEKVRTRAFNLLLQKIIELIKIGFNRKEDQARGIYKIDGSHSYWLGQTINISALFENYKLVLKEWERLRVIKIGDKLYNVNDILTDKVTSRIHRNLTKLYKSSGFMLLHDERLEKMAYRWYQCRVITSGPEEYSRVLQLNGQAGDPANLLNEIEPCDLFLGYPRQNKKD